MVDRVLNRLRRINATYYPQRVFQAPKWLVLGVNNTCNLHCKMCDVGVNYTQSNFFENLMGTRPVHMPLMLFKEIVDQACRYYPSVKLGYAFTEPLIYAHLEQSLQYSRSRGLFTSITTNGLGLKKWAPLLNEVRLGELNISLDGPPDVHNFIRGNEHSFSKAIEGIEALGALNSITPINVYCVITEWNAARLVDFLNCLKPYRINRVGFMHANFTSQMVADQHNLLFGNIYRATASNITDVENESLNTTNLWNEIAAIKRGNWGFEVDFFPNLNSKAELDRYYQEPSVFVGKRCLDIFSNLMIKSNGDVIPAHGRCFNLTIGNLYQQDLRKIWNSAVVSQFRRTVASNGGLLPACSRCCSSFVK